MIVGINAACIGTTMLKAVRHLERDRGISRPPELYFSAQSAHSSNSRPKTSTGKPVGLENGSITLADQKKQPSVALSSGNVEFCRGRIHGNRISSTGLNCVKGCPLNPPPREMNGTLAVRKRKTLQASQLRRGYTKANRDEVPAGPYLGSPRPNRTKMHVIPSTRVAPAVKRGSHANESFQTTSSPAPYVAALEGRPKPALSR